MNDKDKTKEELIEELKELRRELETFKSKEADSAIHYIKDLIWHGQKEKELELNSQQLLSIINATQDAIFVKDEALEYTFVNPALEKLYGCSSDEIIGKTDVNIFDPETGKNMMETERFVLKGRTVEEEHTFEVKGIPTTFHTVKTPLRNEDDEIVGICGIARDITEERFMERARRRNEEQLLAIIDTTRDAILIKDTDLKYIRANPAVEKLFGISPAMLIGRTDEEIFGKDIGAHMKRYDSSVLNGRIIEEETTREVRGVQTTFQTVKAPMRNAKSNIVGICAISRDVTERKLKEEALQQSQSEYQALLDAIPDLVLKIKKDGTISDDNMSRDFQLIQSKGKTSQKIEEMLPKDVAREFKLGKTERVVGKKIEDIFPEDIAQKTMALAQKAMKVEKVQFQEYEYNWDGKRIYYDMRISAIDKQNLVVIVHDITDLKLAEEELIKRNEELDAFSHTVAHDLKNPLGGIIGYSDFLHNNYANLPDDYRKKILNDILGNAQKMKNIISELLLLAGVRKEEIKKVPLDMAEVVKGAQQRLAFVFEKHDADVVVADAWPQVIGYGPWIEEVWANYMSNAIKYGGEPPRVELGVTVEDNGMAKFWVKDNGEGISEEQRKRLFTEFTRFHQVRAQGQGLGLSIVRRIVEKLGGEVDVESEVGEGSVFSFSLPLAEEKSEPSS